MRWIDGLVAGWPRGATEFAAIALAMATVVYVAALIAHVAHMSAPDDRDECAP